MNPFFSPTQAVLKPESSANKEPSANIELSTNKESLTKTASFSPEEKALATILEQEKLCLEQVIQLLKTENEAIIKRDTATMGNLLDKKLPLLSKLEQLDTQRQQFFTQQTNVPYNHQEFSLFIEQHPSETIQNLWKSVKAQLPECKKHNELNGRIISIRQNSTDQILQILLGRPVNNAQTYSHSGQTSQQKRSALYTAV